MADFSNYGSVDKAVGKSDAFFKVSQASRNYTTQFIAASHASGGIRNLYTVLKLTSTGEGEAIRAIGAAGAAASAVGGTINGLHVTGRILDKMGVSGALNALRATLEASGASTQSPGGTLAAVQLDSYIASAVTLPANAAFMRVTDSGAVGLKNLLNITQAIGSQDATALISTVKTAATNWTHAIKIMVGSTPMWIMCTTTTPAT